MKALLALIIVAALGWAGWQGWHDHEALGEVTKERDQALLERDRAQQSAAGWKALATNPEINAALAPLPKATPAASATPAP